MYKLSVSDLVFKIEILKKSRRPSHSQLQRPRDGGSVAEK